MSRGAASLFNLELHELCRGLAGSFGGGFPFKGLIGAFALANNTGFAKRQYATRVLGDRLRFDCMEVGA